MKNEGQIKKESISTLKGVCCTNPGEHIAPVYKRVFDSKYNRNIVKKVDETDLFEFIQASKSSTDLATLQKRFIALGEIPAVDPTLGSNDLSVFPSNIHGVYDMVNDIDNNFKALPDTIKNIFGTSQAYMKALLDGTYQSTIIQAINAQNNVKKEGEETHE